MATSLKQRVEDVGFSMTDQDLLLEMHANDDTVKRASLENRELNNQKLELIAEALQRNTHVTSLNLRSNKVTDVSPLADVVKANTPLRTMILSENHLSPQSLRTLGAALRSNTNLTDLQLDKNVREDGIVALVEGFTSADPPSPDTLAHVDPVNSLSISLRDCEIGNTASHALAQLIRASGRLVGLNLLGARMTAADAAILGTAAGRTNPINVQVNPALEGPLHKARQNAPLESALPQSPPKQQYFSPQSSPSLSSASSHC